MSGSLLTGNPSGQLRICTVSDGVDSVLRLAEYLTQLAPSINRIDLQLSEALGFLHGYAGDEFDLFLMAPDVGRSAGPRMVQAVLDLAASRSARQIVLLPLRSNLTFSGGTQTRLLHGPPFEKFDAVSGDPTAPLSLSPVVEAPRKLVPRGFSIKLPWGRKTTVPVDKVPQPEPTQASPLRVIAFQPMSGGVGATTLAVSTAFELSRMKPALRVCILDLNVQFGNVGTYLDLPQSSKVLDAYRNLRAMDSEAFQTCLQNVGEGLRVFSAPGEVLPLDAMSGADVQQLISVARGVSDLVIIDLPHAITDWSGGVYAESDRICCVSTLDVRAAQNARKVLALMKAEALPLQKLSHLLNRAPRRPSRAWRETCRVFEKGIGTGFAHIFVDGGPDVAQTSDAGLVLTEHRAANPLSSGIRNFCTALLANIDIRAPEAARR